VFTVLNTALYGPFVVDKVGEGAREILILNAVCVAQQSLLNDIPISKSKDLFKALNTTVGSTAVKLFLMPRYFYWPSFLKRGFLDYRLQQLEVGLTSKVPM
jgi:hypothetical protein